MLWARQLVTMVKKKNGKLTVRGFRPIAMPQTMYLLYSKVLQQLAGQAIHTRYSPQYGHVPGRQAHEVVFILRRMVEQANEWRIPIFVMDCDVAAAFDHVSHRLIIDAMEVLKVPPVLVPAWIREYRGSETKTKLDDVITPGIRRTRSVPQGDPCAADLFGAALDVPATAFCERCQAGKWELPVGGNYLGLLLFAHNCWLIAMSPAELKSMARAWNEPLEKAGLRIARQPLTVWRQKLWWRTRWSLEGRENEVSKPWVRGSHSMVTSGKNSRDVR